MRRFFFTSVVCVVCVWRGVCLVCPANGGMHGALLFVCMWLRGCARRGRVVVWLCVGVV